MNVVQRLTDNRFFRFLVTGALNTTVTFGIYFLFRQIFDYQMSYFLSFLCGVFFSYFLNVYFVFNTHVSIKTFIRFPFVYIAQYIFGALLLELLVQVLGVSVTFAPLFVIVFTLPLTFLLSRFVLSKF